MLNLRRVLICVLRRSFSDGKRLTVMPTQANEIGPFDTVSMVRSKGYPIESHSYTTEDGYILTTHRIPGAKNKPLKKSSPAIILQHGLWSSSSDWIVTGPGHSFGYLFADAGFDVWLPNSRGNMYSRGHQKYIHDRDVKQYWNFSWHEMGYFDLPATIDYILKLTGQEQVYYMGHSQGTTTFFVMTSSRPEYNRKVKAMAGLAPVVYLTHVRSSVLRSLAKLTDPLLGLGYLTGNYRLPETWAIKIANDILVKTIANNVLDSMCSYACSEVRQNLLPIAMAHMNTGASLKQLAHYGQICRQPSFYFRHFDYGEKENVKMYGNQVPPEYNLKAITAPVLLFYSDFDWLVHPADVKALYDQLPSKKELVKIDLQNFNHLDFMWSVKSRELIFDKVVSAFGLQRPFQGRTE